MSVAHLRLPTAPTSDRRGDVLGFLASLAAVSGDYRAAEGYLLELLAWCAFRDHEGEK